MKTRYRLIRKHGLWRCQVKRPWWFWQTLSRTCGSLVGATWDLPMEFVNREDAERHLKARMAEDARRALPMVKEVLKPEDSAR